MKMHYRTGAVDKESLPETSMLQVSCHTELELVRTFRANENCSSGVSPGSDTTISSHKRLCSLIHTCMYMQHIANGTHAMNHIIIPSIEEAIAYDLSAREGKNRHIGTMSVFRAIG